MVLASSMPVRLMGSEQECFLNLNTDILT